MRKLLVFLWLGTWLYLCLIPALEAQTASYSAWREQGCPVAAGAMLAPAGLCQAPQNHLVRGLLLWAVTAPLLGWALWRTPRRWPSKLYHFFWDGRRTGLSVASLALLLVVTGSAGFGVVNAPYAAARWANAVALALVLLSGACYRAVLLSAAPAYRPS